MKISKSDLKKIIYEVLTENEEEAQADPQGPSSVQVVLDLLNKRVFELDAVQTYMTAIKRNPTLKAALLAQINQVLGVAEDEVSGLAQRTRQQQQSWEKARAKTTGGDEG